MFTVPYYLIFQFHSSHHILCFLDCLPELPQFSSWPSYFQPTNSLPFILYINVSKASFIQYTTTQFKDLAPQHNKSKILKPAFRTFYPFRRSLLNIYLKQSKTNPRKPTSWSSISESEQYTLQINREHLPLDFNYLHQAMWVYYLIYYLLNISNCYEQDSFSEVAPSNPQNEYRYQKTTPQIICESTKR